MFFLSFFLLDTTCGSNEFQCIGGICKYEDNENCSGRCIRGDWAGDGEPDCTDASDEGKCLKLLNVCKKANLELDREYVQICQIFRFFKSHFANFILSKICQTMSKHIKM